MRRKIKNKHCALQVLHSVKHSLQGLATLITAVNGFRMVTNSIRIPTQINKKASHVLNQYNSGELKACRIKCGNMSLRVGRKWRLLSKDNGQCWEIMSHEKYNNLKDRR
ncbi:ParE family toxin-like protein [Klebsiella aerogenes]|uniref:ParE family toxin-like protein n=1 Tax=Klebsiella aerogenes TaxID=548 RepID=UPI004057C86E